MLKRLSGKVAKHVADTKDIWSTEIPSSPLRVSDEVCAAMTFCPTTALRLHSKQVRHLTLGVKAASSRQIILEIGSKSNYSILLSKFLVAALLVSTTAHRWPFVGKMSQRSRSMTRKRAIVTSQADLRTFWKALANEARDAFLRNYIAWICTVYCVNYHGSFFIWLSWLFVLQAIPVQNS